MMAIIQRRPSSLFALERRKLVISTRHVYLCISIFYTVCIIIYYVLGQQKEEQPYNKIIHVNDIPAGEGPIVKRNNEIINHPLVTVPMNVKVPAQKTIISKNSKDQTDETRLNSKQSKDDETIQSLFNNMTSSSNQPPRTKPKSTSSVVIQRMEVGNTGDIPKIKETLNRHVKVPSNKKQSLWITEYMSPVDIPDRPSITDLIYVTDDGKRSHVYDNADVSWLLDYALIGMAKTGTTSLLRYVNPTLAREERCDLVIEDVAVMVNSLYRHYSPIHKNNGFKCPQDITSSLHVYATYFPKTKLVVGIRHPIRWFESLYNYRLTQTSQILPTHKLTKACISGSKGICAWRAHIADFLSVMSKTPLQTDHEKSLLPLHLPPIPSTQTLGPVFLYDLQQLISTPQILQKDLQQFLQISSSFVSNRHIPHLNKNKANNSRRRQIDICQEEHIPIRQALMEIARKSSIWIRTYFLQSPDVYVSNKQQLIDILEHEWMVDPCDTII